MMTCLRSEEETGARRTPLPLPAAPAPRHFLLSDLGFSLGFMWSLNRISSVSSSGHGGHRSAVEHISNMIAEEKLMNVSKGCWEQATPPRSH